jgi:hypothetical protein
MKYFKLIAKIFAVLALVFAMGLGALIWRIQHAPLDLKFLLSYWQTKDAVVKVDSIQLEKSAFYRIPQINIQNLRYTTPDVEVTCQNIRGHWKIWNVLAGNFSLSSLILFKPKIIIRLKDTAEKTSTTECLTESLNVLQGLPFSNLTVTEGELVVIPADPATPCITVGQLNLTIEHRIRLSNLELQGRLFNRIPITGTGHFHHRTLNAHALLHLKEVTAQDFAAYTAPVKDYLPLFGKETLNMEASVHLGAKTETTLSWNPIHKPGHKFSAQLVQAPLQPLELVFTLPSLDVSALPAQWPATLAPEVRTWILENIPHGEITSTEIKVSLSPGTHEVTKVQGTTHLQNAIVKVWDRLSPLQVDSATFTFDQDNLSVLLHRGTLEGLPLENGKIILSNGMENIHIHTSTKGQVPNIFKLLDTLKIEHPLVTLETKGTSNLNIEIGFPLQDPMDLKLNIHGDLKHTAGTLKLRNQLFPFTHGEFNLGFSNEVFSLRGNTLVQNKPIQLSLRKEKPMDPQSIMTYDIQGHADSKIAQSFVPVWLQDTFKEGVIAFHIISSLTPEHEEITKLAANLKMVRLNIAPLGWKKLRNADATLQLEMRTKDTSLFIPKIQIESPTLNIHGDLQLKNGTVENVNINATVKNKQQLKISTQRTPKGLLLFSVSSNFLDARPLIKYYLDDKSLASSEESPSPYQLDLEIRNIILENGVQVPLLKGKIMDSGPQLTFMDITANTTKGGELSLSLKPKDTNSVLEIKASKFDEFMRGLNLHQKVIMETIDLTATRPLKQLDKPYEGKMVVEKIHVYNAPFMGHFLSILSLESLISQLSGKGLLFVLGEVEFGFAQKKFTIHRSAITSTALGLSFEGVVDLKNKILNLRGAAVPINVLNKFIGNIPVIGTLLTGGDKDNGVFSSSYKITGSFDNPDVSSNPLGIVVPGVIKKIFGGLTGTNAKPT